MRRVRTLLEAAGILAVRGILRLFPLRWVSQAGQVLGWLLFAVFRPQRRQTLDNLAIAFGDRYSPLERRRLAARCYMHFGGVLTEFVTLIRLAGKNLEPYVTLENPELLDEALQAGRGVLMVSGHLGNWELMGAAIAARGIPISLYVGQQHNPFADAFLNHIRQSMGEGIISKQSAMRGMIRTLRANQIVGMLPDQHYSKNRYFIRFFGKPVSAAPGPASLVRHSQPSVVFGETIRVGLFRYRTRFHPVPVPAPSGDEELDVLRISQSIYDLLEAAVRRHPDQYFWMHRRWRNPPPAGQLTETNRAFLAANIQEQKPDTGSPDNP